jgi:hypothetical protein
MRIAMAGGQVANGAFFYIRCRRNWDEERKWVLVGEEYSPQMQEIHSALRFSRRWK